MCSSRLSASASLLSAVDVNRDGIRTATVFYPVRVFYEQHFPTDMFVNRAGLEYVRDVMALEEQA